ncbi:hypothetical protein TELCIR_11054 [Teladorsagia circumcincta]|uniref:Uncharacterized protein n=1 Tax=Teladorsagia circumcincta TaxID=45464 RepID=A0A2G9UAC8_TELCI|nr:hypothetical protein TELCIR_11054 [Teladorsagia circumcincta]
MIIATSGARHGLYWSHRNQILWNDHPGYVKMHYMCERKMCPLDEQIK